MFGLATQEKGAFAFNYVFMDCSELSTVIGDR